MWPAPPGGGEGYPGEGWRAMGGMGGLIALYGENGMLGPHHLGTKEDFLQHIAHNIQRGANIGGIL